MIPEMEPATGGRASFLSPASSGQLALRDARWFVHASGFAPLLDSIR